jgi:hypothetical protein
VEVDLEAVVAGKACWRERPERAEPRSEETQTALELAVREYDRTHERLTAERRYVARPAGAAGAVGTEEGSRRLAYRYGRPGLASGVAIPC